MVECPNDEVKVFFEPNDSDPLSHLVEDWAKAEGAEPAGQLVQPGQLPRSFLVGRERRRRRAGIAIQARQGGERAQLGYRRAALVPRPGQRRVRRRQRRTSGAGTLIRSILQLVRNFRGLWLTRDTWVRAPSGR